MKLIHIKWFHHLDIGLRGSVTITESSINEIMAEWNISISENGDIHHSPKNGRMLPPLCQHRYVMDEVESMVKIYLDGFNRNETCNKWIIPIDPI